MIPGRRRAIEIGAGAIGEEVQDAAQTTSPMPGAVQVRAVESPKRDWVAWYEDLSERERRALRDRLMMASPDEVKAEDELRYFFLFHLDDLAHEQPPGTRRLLEFHHVVMTLRGREDMAEERRKAVQYLLAEYQHYLRDNPFAC